MAKKFCKKNLHQTFLSQKSKFEELKTIKLKVKNTKMQ